jgi:hypothetical protein
VAQLARSETFQILSGLLPSLEQAFTTPNDEFDALDLQPVTNPMSPLKRQPSVQDLKTLLTQTKEVPELPDTSSLEVDYENVPFTSERPFTPAEPWRSPTKYSAITEVDEESCVLQPVPPVTSQAVDPSPGILLPLTYRPNSEIILRSMPVTSLPSFVSVPALDTIAGSTHHIEQVTAPDASADNEPPVHRAATTYESTHRRDRSIDRLRSISNSLNPFTTTTRRGNDPSGNDADIRSKKRRAARNRQVCIIDGDMHVPLKAQKRLSSPPEYFRGDDQGPLRRRSMTPGWLKIVFRAVS